MWPWQRDGRAGCECERKAQERRAWSCVDVSISCAFIEVKLKTYSDDSMYGVSSFIFFVLKTCILDLTSLFERPPGGRFLSVRGYGARCAVRPRPDRQARVGAQNWVWWGSAREKKLPYLRGDINALLMKK